MEPQGILYKGQYKYKYVPYGIGAKAILEQFTIKFTDPVDFNDPFDCHPSYYESAMIAEQKKLFRNLCEQSGIPPAKRMMKWKQAEAQLRQNKSNNSFQRELQKQIGVCSLTTKPCNLLMWAHYAKNHTGVVFEFNNKIPDDMKEQSKYLCALYVDYQVDKPVLDIFDGNYVHDFLTKGKDWEYEDEIRCLNIENGSGIYNFEPEILESVILGVKISESDEKEIKQIISKINKTRNDPINLYKTKFVEDKFKLYIPKHPLYGDSNWE